MGCACGPYGCAKHCVLGQVVSCSRYMVGLQRASANQLSPMHCSVLAHGHLQLQSSSILCGSSDHCTHDCLVRGTGNMHSCCAKPVCSYHPCCMVHQTTAHMVAWCGGRELATRIGVVPNQSGCLTTCLLHLGAAHA